MFIWSSLWISFSYDRQEAHAKLSRRDWRRYAFADDLSQRIVDWLEGLVEDGELLDDQEQILCFSLTRSFLSELDLLANASCLYFPNTRRTSLEISSSLIY